MFDFSHPDTLYNEFLRAKGALTRYTQRVQCHTAQPDWRKFRSLQSRYNQLHREVYGK